MLLIELLGGPFDGGAAEIETATPSRVPKLSVMKLRHDRNHDNAIYKLEHYDALKERFVYSFIGRE